ncbi:MAG: 30S ribosome-binding factor RbfA [Chloroflexi bacterium]|nr:30S ribosome-binding factor RbfA [Chloroflexota bacterium]
MASRRILRVNEALRRELAELLREVQDPELAKLISITEVDTSPDLRQARVYVSVLGDEDEIVRTIRRLQHAAGFFRRELAARVNLRYTPALVFKPDRSIAQGARVLELLHEVEPPQVEG